MPPPPRMVTLLVVEAGPGGDAPRWRRHPDRQVAQTRQGQGQGVLGHRLGVGALGARPDPVIVEQAGLGHPLDPGEGQLHPAGVGHLGQPHGQAVDIPRVQPHQAVGSVVQSDHLAPSGPHGIGGELGRERADGDTGRGHGVTLAR